MPLELAWEEDTSLVAGVDIRQVQQAEEARHTGVERVPEEGASSLAQLVLEPDAG